MSSSTADSEKLEPGCKMIHEFVPSSSGFSCRMATFQLSGFHCNSDKVVEPISSDQ